jgi:predicted DNA-binding transcriptional regulator AlpA
MQTDQKHDPVLNRDPVMTKRQAATYIGLSLAALDRERALGRFADEIALSARRLGWRRSALDEWLKSRVVKRAKRAAEQIEARGA